MRIRTGKYAYFLLILLFLLAYSPDAVTRRKGRSDDKDSLLTLLNAEYARVFERPGNREYREVKGPATFLHNGAYMFCDSAIWNVSLNQIEAYQNVKLVQDKTVITSDNVIYYADDNLARFRGELVEVRDKDKNTLRTRYLDYNTEDSVAKFSFGGAMRTAKGEVIESDRGTYDAKTGICRFDDNVEMFTDSLFIKTSRLDYDTNLQKAYFFKMTQMWKDDVYMRGESGWYQQDSGVVYFDTNVYMDNPDYESWCDTLYYYQHTRRALMRSNVQLLDSLNKTYFVSDAGNMWFDTVNNLYASLFLDPAAIVVGENTDHQIDTLFCRADTLLFYTQRMCDLTEEQLQDSKDAIQQVSFDAIGEAERKAAEKKEQEIQQAIEKLPEYIAYKKRQEIAQKRIQDSIAAVQAQAEKDSLAAKAVADSLAALALADSLAKLPAGDSLALPPVADSLAAMAAPDTMAAVASPAEGDKPELPALDTLAALPDSLAVRDSLAVPDSLSAAVDSLAAPAAPKDTTQIRFVKGYRHAIIYRTDVQARCDSLYFSQLDTLLRMYEDPVIWNENRHQLSAESVLLQMRDNAFDRANLHGNAMIISQEDSLHFDQIKATEMLGYFNSDNTLRRYDALGGVTAMFYMQEDSIITILNSKQAQYMMVTMKNGVAERLKYYEQINSDAFPIYNLPMDKQRLKGFKWRMDEQPKSRFEVTRRKLRHSKRASYKANKLPTFKRTDHYFDNYMTDIYQQIADRAEQARLEQLRRDSIEAALQEEQIRMAADSAMGISNAFTPEGDVRIDSLDTPLHTPVVKQDTVSKSATPVLGIEGIANHSDEGFVEVQVPREGHKLTAKDKRALRKAARQLRRDERRLKREARKAERAAKRAARAAEREAKKKKQ